MYNLDFQVSSCWSSCSWCWAKMERSSFISLVVARRCEPQFSASSTHSKLSTLCCVLWEFPLCFYRPSCAPLSFSEISIGHWQWGGIAQQGFTLLLLWLRPSVTCSTWSGEDVCHWHALQGNNKCMYYNGCFSNESTKTKFLRLMTALSQSILAMVVFYLNINIAERGKPVQELWESTKMMHRFGST